MVYLKTIFRMICQYFNPTLEIPVFEGKAVIPGVFEPLSQEQI